MITLNMTCGLTGAWVDYLWIDLYARVKRTWVASLNASCMDRDLSNFQWYPNNLNFCMDNGERQYFMSPACPILYIVNYGNYHFNGLWAANRPAFSVENISQRPLWVLGDRSAQGHSLFTFLEQNENMTDEEFGAFWYLKLRRAYITWRLNFLTARRSWLEGCIPLYSTDLNLMRSGQERIQEQLAILWTPDFSAHPHKEEETYKFLRSVHSSPTWPPTVIKDKSPEEFLERRKALLKAMDDAVTSGQTICEGLKMERLNAWRLFCQRHDPPSPLAAPPRPPAPNGPVLRSSRQVELQPMPPTKMYFDPFNIAPPLPRDGESLQSLFKRIQVARNKILQLVQERRSIQSIYRFFAAKEDEQFPLCFPVMNPTDYLNLMMDAIKGWDPLQFHIHIK